MNYDAILGAVQTRAYLPSRTAAEAAVQAALTTLADRIPQAAAHQLADQLPGEIAHHLRGGRIEKLPLDEFYERSSKREGVDRSAAAFHARVVIGLIAQSVAPGVIASVLRELPESFGGLFHVPQTAAGRA